MYLLFTDTKDHGVKYMLSILKSILGKSLQLKLYYMKNILPKYQGNLMHYVSHKIKTKRNILLLIR